MSYTTIDALIAALEKARGEMGGGTEVRVAQQPSWPRRGTIAAVTVPDPRLDDKRDGQMLWLAVGSPPFEEVPYAPDWAWPA